MIISKVASVGSSKFSLGFHDFLRVSAFYFQSFNQKMEGSKESANCESRIKECEIRNCLYKIFQVFCESHKLYFFYSLFTWFTLITFLGRNCTWYLPLTQITDKCPAIPK